MNADEIASVNPVSKLTAEVIVGQDNTINYTLITLKNGVKVNAKESPYQIANSGIAELVFPYGVKGDGASGPKADYTAKHGHGTQPWAPDANLERSRVCCATGPVEAPAAKDALLSVLNPVQDKP